MVINYPNVGVLRRAWFFATRKGTYLLVLVAASIAVWVPKSHILYVWYHRKKKWPFPPIVLLFLKLCVCFYVIWCPISQWNFMIIHLFGNWFCSPQPSKTKVVYSHDFVFQLLIQQSWLKSWHASEFTIMNCLNFVALFNYHFPHLNISVTILPFSTY